VHRPVGEQLEDRGTHVTAPAASAATGSAAAASARSTGTAWAEATGTEAEAASRAETAGTEASWTECRSETEAGVSAAAVFTDVVAEVATGLFALFVQGAAVTGTESESWTAHEWALELTLGGPFVEWGAHVCVLLSTGNAEIRFRYIDDISETIAMQLLT
jgi:hypothetical protein